MTDPSVTPAVQFTKAEYADPGAATATCALCQHAVGDRYFEVNGQTTCEACAEQVRQAHGVRPGVGGFARAVIAGIAAGAAGALLYYGVLALTGYEFGLIAVVVGYMVGRAVHWGSSGRGGALYQTTAVALTYLAIVTCYVPFIIEGLSKAPQQEAAAATAAEPATTAAPGEEPPPSGRDIVLFFGIFAAIVLASPFLGGFSNVIGWLIIGFALFEAWKINRRVDVAITGPYDVAKASTA